MRHAISRVFFISPVLRLLGDVHGKVAQGDLYVQDSRHSVGHQEVASPRPGALPSKRNERKQATVTNVKGGGRQENGGARLAAFRPMRRPRCEASRRRMHRVVGIGAGVRAGSSLEIPCKIGQKHARPPARTPWQLASSRPTVGVRRFSGQLLPEATLCPNGGWQGWAWTRTACSHGTNVRHGSVPIPSRPGEYTSVPTLRGRGG